MVAVSRRSPIATARGAGPGAAWSASSRAASYRSRATGSLPAPSPPGTPHAPPSVSTCVVVIAWCSAAIESLRWLSRVWRSHPAHGVGCDSSCGVTSAAEPRAYSTADSSSSSPLPGAATLVPRPGTGACGVVLAGESEQPEKVRVAEADDPPYPCRGEGEQHHRVRVIATARLALVDRERRLPVGRHGNQAQAPRFDEEARPDEAHHGRAAREPGELRRHLQGGIL